ncbi:MAG: nucleotidyltransferase family protein [Gammaproteobacteria bacterium]|nr:nucleotidyltransferase family protein [Gammaproteobacteria bacterium]MBT3722548.1 nucleotidyltransferase family protein [Gammaproteobacteria bacterium]MBT4076724.1 nucleotidyltransferase family protein [Gammaproteobacteria bacterium]MBT4196254.1 nucleotidyltransferase family protein [Gammaproteobacteria bacterium]MBT4449507.1 nucleotidyltransferase family protein [Gammaproteobacteria bacterium]
MNAMILAAGRGERMRPLTDNCPKPLLKVKGKPLISYHLEALKKAGITSVVINVSWLGDQIQLALGDGSAFGLRIQYSVENDALETAGGIIQALDKLDDEFIVVNGDVFTDYDFSNLLIPTADAHLVLVPNPEHNPSGDFGIDNGLLLNTSNQQHTFAGISCYRKSFFSGLDQGQRALPPLLRAGADQQNVSAELFDGLWNDVGTAERLEQLQ